MKPMGIGELLLRIEQTESTIEKAKDIIEKAEATRDRELLGVSNVLFDLAGLAEDHDDALIKQERILMMKKQKVNIHDQRWNTWNGNSEDVMYDWDGVEFAGKCGEPSIWFWSGDNACYYYPNDSLGATPPFWVIFSTNKVVTVTVVEKEEINGTEKKNRQVH